ncbi:MAG: hypothetical protein UX04_C0005G0014 [Microgenomates group bacterium GW2011_GWF2_45_18]|nr:MAG: hypothetical protein UW18_C0007G0015 [Microgenomates group bacterium GW2011_GWF1_44_10]KKU01595.1 MAG: hypothetical protein UX04_C0005G0014 [Microgenomates group bacterium GW2011_GWF2_45_18]OGJ41550.1 MAG: hypothetical protein A2378_01415 [Candidatus Pacebacteria bacterium RIFOXYB1_FULL_44_10]HAU99524.1 hypothetical protein [Candidatus Paceibacterota bacterium]HAX01335.1 hypothetical protein [Candidatus Paceibacterota bacterium]
MNPAQSDPSVSPLVSAFPQAPFLTQTQHPQTPSQTPTQLPHQTSVHSGVGSKESPRYSPDLSPLAEIPGAQVIEDEPNPEISPEVESWMEKVDRKNIDPPKEVVVADKTATNPTGNYAAQPVIVLPISKPTLTKGLTQNVQYSVRWLAEWCLRIIKKFGGMVVYRPMQESTQEKS